MTIYTIVIKVDSYHFQVSGTNKDRLWDDAIAIMKFLCQDKFWQVTHLLQLELQSYTMAPVARV